MRCPPCGHENRSDGRFCTHCGAPLRRACPSCGASAEPDQRFCGACGTPLAEPGEPAPVTARGEPEHAANLPAGERRHLTVLFSDLVGSTELSTKLDPEEWRDVVGAYQRTVMEVVARFGGHVAKWLGDGALASFGWPQAHEDDAERAVRAALALLEALTATDAPTRLGVRIGLHTGAVVVGDDGEFYGETPNVAARVQTVADGDTILITAATHRLVAGLFVVESHGAPTLKGVPEPVELYRVLQASGVRSRLDVPGRRLTPYIGRDLELGVLLDRWERTQEGEGQAVIVTGDAGMGKSRIVQMLRERLTAQPHTWLECRCTPYTEHSAFHPVIELLERGLELAPDDSRATKLAKLERALILDRMSTPDVVALFAAFLGIAGDGGGVSLPLSPDAQRRRTMDALMEWTFALAEPQPLLLLVEDLHWADASSLELIGRFIEQLPRTTLMLVGTARPSFTAPWAARSHLSPLRLDRLTRRQAREMIAACAGRQLPPAIVDAIVARADGIPLYIEELTRMAVDSGLASTPGALTIPATLHDSLMARLDHLGAAKEVAQRASVLGREFPYRLLADVASMDETTLRVGLEGLADAELLFARGEPPDAVYTFKHALIQEAAYESLLKRTRQQLHARVARGIEATADPEVTARHYEAAGMAAEAFRHYERAAAEGAARSAHEEAIAHGRKALTVLATLPDSRERDAREMRLQLGLGAALIPVRGWGHPDTVATYERARALAESTGDLDGLATTLMGVAGFVSSSCDWDATNALSQRLLELGERMQEDFVTLYALGTFANVHYYRGHFADALRASEGAHALYDAERHHVLGSGTAGAPARFPIEEDIGVSSQFWRAFALSNLGWPDRAVAAARDMVALARRLSHPFSLASALLAESFVYWMNGDAAQQLALAEESIAVSEAHGFPLWLAFARALRASASVDASNAVAVASEIEEAIAMNASTGNHNGEPWLWTALADVQRSAGRYEDALRTIDEALAIAAATDQPFWDSELHRLRGEVLAACGTDDAAAEAALRRAVETARGLDARTLELRAATSLARSLADRGRYVEGLALLTPIYAWFTEGFATGNLVQAKALLDTLAG